MLPARRTARTALVAAVCFLACAVSACKTTNTPSASGPTGSGPAATSTTAADGGTAVTGSPAMAGGDPCALITPADVKAALSEDVTAVKRLAAKTDEDGTSQQCVLITTGPPMSGPGMAALAGMSGALGGGKVDPGAAGSGAIGVTLMNFAGAQDPNDANGGDQPPFFHQVSGIGLMAAVVTPPTQGAAAICLVSKTKGTYIMDIEGRVIPPAQMESLLRAAVARIA